MKLKSGYPFPLIKSGLPFDYPKLERDRRTDVVVLGGGISGALCAHYLVEAGIDCTVVDARTIGLGSTCASTSLLQYEIDTPLVKLVSLAGMKNAVRAYRLCAGAIQELGKLAARVGLHDFRFKPSLWYARYRKDIPLLREEFSLRKKQGFAIRYLSESMVRREFGFAAPAALLSELAADTNAYLFTHQLHQYNLARGLPVFDRTPVVSIRHSKKGIVLKTGNGYLIRAKKLVYATGYEAVEMISKPIVKLKTTFATASEPMKPSPPYWKQDALIWSTGDAYLYIRSTPDHRVIVGGRDTEQTKIPTEKIMTGKTRTLQKDFSKLFPNRNFIPEFSWAGIFGSTRDGLPYIGPYKNLANSYFALGFGGNGITFSQVAARIIPDLVKGKKNSDASIFAFERNS